MPGMSSEGRSALHSADTPLLIFLIIFPSIQEGCDNMWDTEQGGGPDVFRWR